MSSHLLPVITDYVHTAQHLQLVMRYALCLTVNIYRLLGLSTIFSSLPYQTPCYMYSQYNRPRVSPLLYTG